MDGTNSTAATITGGVDTHKDLHVAAVVDERDRVLGTRSFPTTRQGYRQMLAWMRTFGELRRIGIESTGSYGAGLLRYMQAAHIEVMECFRHQLLQQTLCMMVWMPLLAHHHTAAHVDAAHS